MHEELYASTPQSITPSLCSCMLKLLNASTRVGCDRCEHHTQPLLHDTQAL